METKEKLLANATNEHDRELMENKRIEHGNGINKQAVPWLIAMIIYLGLLWLPIGLRNMGVI